MVIGNIGFPYDPELIVYSSVAKRHDPASLAARCSFHDALVFLCEHDVQATRKAEFARLIMSRFIDKYGDLTFGGEVECEISHFEQALRRLLDIDGSVEMTREQVIARSNYVYVPLSDR